jgi:DivIVA domain-containing protein
MSCRECAAEVALTARVCSRCGAPVVGQQPPVVADTVVGAFSDAAGKVVPAGVAGQAPPEPYVPGSGARVPAELRLVLGGYAGIACGLFAGGLACGVAAVFVFFFAADIDTDPDMIEFLIFMISYLIAVAGVVCICGLLGLSGALDTLQACIRFSRLLRQPSDPRTATVTASERGGRTLRLDIIPRDSTGRGYQPLSEVRLALWTKAGMLVPGETVEIYAEHRPAHMGPGGSGKSPLLVSSPQRGRAFLGTAKSATVQPGPVTSLDEKVSGATLVDWAAWAASTTFSSTGLRFGYDKREVDAFRSAVRDTLLGVSRPAVRSDDLRGKQFSTHRPGYNKKQVAAFLEAAGLRLAAMESTDRPAGPLVSGALLVAWAEWADSTRFSTTAHLLQGYDTADVDAFREELRDTFLGVRQPPVVSGHVRGKQFSTHRPGYDKTPVDAFTEKAAWRLAAMESTDKPQGPLVSWILAEWAEWAEWADSTRFETTRPLGEAYDAAEVDAFRGEIRDTFLGVRQPPLTSHAVHCKQFTPTRVRGYDVQQVDAFLDQAELRLAAMLP